MFRKRIFSVFLVMILLMSTVTGCTKTEEQILEQQMNSITVTDQIGRKVTIEKCDRIVSAYYISSSLLIALGAKDSVVGIEMKADTREIYKKAAPEFLKLPAIGSGKGVNVEEIAALNPDIVILPLKLKDTVLQFEKLDIPVLVIDPETMNNFINCIDLLANITGQNERGQELIQYYNDSMKTISDKTKNISEKPKVYLSAGADYLNTCTSKMYQNDLISIAGGDNVSKNLEDGYWQTISAEQLLQWNPEYMFMVGYAQYTKEQIMVDTRLTQLDAIVNDKVFVFPSKLEPWDYPTPSSVLGIFWLTNKLHPDLYSKDEYVNEAKEFYNKYYNIDVSEEELGL